MTLLLERPVTGPDTPADFDGQYLFFVGFVIVGWANADCWVCAWKEGYPRWRDCRMAVAVEYDECDVRAACHQQPVAGGWVFFSGGYIEGVVFADCGPCALRRGLPSWPGSRQGLVVPCEPGDVNLQCRNERKKRRGPGL